MYKQHTSYSRQLSRILGLLGMLFLSGGACLLNKIQEKVWPSEQNETDSSSGVVDTSPKQESISEYNPPDATEIKEKQEVAPNRGHKNGPNEPDKPYDLSGMRPNIREQEPYSDSLADGIKIGKNISEYVTEKHDNTINICLYLPQESLNKDDQSASDEDSLRADDAYTEEGSNIDTVKNHNQNIVIQGVSASAEKEHKQVEKLNAEQSCSICVLTLDEEKYGVCSKPSCEHGDDCDTVCIHQRMVHNPGYPICRQAVQEKMLEPQQVYNPEQLQQIPQEMGIDEPASQIDPIQTEQEDVRDEKEALVQQVEASIPQTVMHSQQEPSQKVNNESIKQMQEEEEIEIDEDKEEEKKKEEGQKNN